jgi:ferredoxin
MNITDQPGWPKEVDIDAGFKVKISGGTEFEARAGETLLTALEKQGLVVPSECRSGECSMCRVKVLSGRVYQPAGALVRKSDRKFGYVHSCVSYPLTDLEIII